VLGAAVGGGRGDRLTPRILIATPVYGNTDAAPVALGYARASARLLCAPNVRLLEDALFFSDDLVRGRSRAACEAVERRPTHVLWWDSDVVPKEPAEILGWMLASGHDVIGAPYPVKRIKARFPYRVGGSDEGTTQVEGTHYCVRIDDIAMGFMLVRVEVLEKLIGAHRDELWFSDVRPGQPTVERVAIFAQMFGPPSTAPDGTRFRTLDSEDYSFCRRWRDTGGKIHMYVGPGAPLAHVGAHKFEATIEEIGQIR
jgi:hypothetical protein